MKKFHVVLMLAVSMSFLTLGGCKKNTDVQADTDLTSAVTTQSEDHSMFSAEDDAVSDDVNAFMDNDAMLGGRNTSVICGATITRDSSATTKGIVINYNGANCAGNRIRMGIVTITMPRSMHWKDAGAQLTVDIQNLKITRVSDSASVTMNGTKTITNVTGHLIRELASFTPIIHTIKSSNMSVAFDNGTSRQWQIAKQRTFSYSGGAVISTEGTQTVDGADRVAVWGTNRLGQSFATRILEPMTVRQDCDFRLTSGKIEHTKLTRPITVTFGLNSSGAATSCPGAGNSYYFKAEWTSLSGTPHSVIKPY